MNRIVSVIIALACAIQLSLASNSQKTTWGKDAPKMGVIGGKTPAMLNLNGGSKKNTIGLAARKAPQAASSFKSSSYGFVDGPDGTIWTYTQDAVATASYTYSSVDIKVYDSKQQPQGGFTIEIPSTMRINQVEVTSMITSRMFDFNSTTKECMVYMHEVTPDYVGKDHIWVYSLDGTKAGEFEGDGMVVDAPVNEWTTFQRFVLSHKSADGKNVDIDIYRPATWGEDAPQVEHTFSLPENLTTYTDAPYFNFANIDGKPYFVLCHYDKSFVEYDEDGNQKMDYETFMPYFTADNSFHITAYDKNYNEVTDFSIPTTVKSDTYIVRMLGLGAFSDMDISRGYFTGDDQLNFIVMNEDVTITTEYVTSFDVYNQKGEKLGTLAEDVGDYWTRLTSIPGKEDQWAFLSADNSGMFIVETPSMRPITLPPTVDEYSISSNINRVIADNEDGYEYIMGINEAATNDKGDVIAMYAYLDTNFNPTRYVKINLGPLAQTFTPLMTTEGLDPYLFNTDDSQEFLFLSKVKKSETTDGGYNVLFVANDKGEILDTFGGEADADKGDIWTAAILNHGTPQASLFVDFYDWDHDLNTQNFYSLPIIAFSAGGTGTTEDPYLISSVGDLRQIANHPSASYRLAKGFSAKGYPVAVSEFTGSLDGAGYTISDLDVTSENYYGGLFGVATGATIHDLNLYNPIATGSGDNAMLAILSGWSIGSNIERVNIVGADVEVTQRGTTPVGILIGQATGETKISDCYISESSMNAQTTSVGAIAGEMRTASVISRCAVEKTTVKGNAEVGAITGTEGTDCTIQDCYIKESSVQGRHTLGAVAGTCGVNGNRANINRCLVVGGEIEAQTKTNIGGIVGSLEPQWDAKAEPKGDVSGNVTVNLAIKTAGEASATLHRIAGYTIANEVETRNDVALKNNYVCADGLATDGSCYTTSSTDATSPEGEDITTASVIAQDFWTGLGYALGMTADAPWVKSADGLPYLYIATEENLPSGISSIAIQRPTNDKAYNLRGQELRTVRRGELYITGGKVRIAR